MKKAPLISKTEIMQIDCDDEYEAEKLMWILSPNREQHKLKHVNAISVKEMILVLDDGSSHSVMMADKQSAARLQRTAKMILYEGKKLLSIRAHRNTVQVDIE
jgi:hypothetical protein